MKYSLVLSITATSALLALYVNFAAVFVQADPLKGATSLESSIFLLQFFKVAAIASIKSLRNSSSATIVDIFGAELVVLLPALVIGNLYFGMESAPALMVQILLAWIAGVMTFGTPLAAYRIAKAMAKGEALVSVLPSMVFLSELMALLVVGANASASSGLGLAGLSRAILLVGGGITSPGTQVVSVTALPPLVIVYITLILYALSPRDLAISDQFRGVAGLALLATAVTLAGAYEASQFALPLTLTVLPPVLLTSFFMWWITREI